MFCLESGEAVATDKMMEMKLVSEIENSSESDTLLLKTFAISNVKKGLWIAGMKFLFLVIELEFIQMTEIIATAYSLRTL